LGLRIKPLFVRIGRTAWAAASVVFLVFVVGFWLRGRPFTADSSLSASIDVIGAFLSFTIAANTLVRFRGTRDRMPLVLAIGFGASGLLELGATLELFRYLATVGPLIERARMSWMQSRTLLAETMLLAIAMERRGPQQRDPEREIGSALTLVGTVGYLTSALYFIFSGQPPIRSHTLLARPWELLPAVLFALAAVGFHQRLRKVSSALDHALAISAWMNVGCHLMMLESARVLDAPSALAQTLRVSSYAVVLGGTLLDNSQLFMQVHHLAVTDPLTGLANYRRLVDVLEAEIERSGRTGRGFAVMLLDLDGLKTINDQYGHQVGSRALRRLADVLRVHSRSMDTAARYGGDEFAIVLPETTEQAAHSAAARVRERLAAQAERPKLSVSIGVAVYPLHGTTADRLLVSADHALYAMKQTRKHS
jgi:diguanylate cyclase (GGDEF)-like protein